MLKSGFHRSVREPLPEAWGDSLVALRNRGNSLKYRTAEAVTCVSTEPMHAWQLCGIEGRGVMARQWDSKAFDATYARWLSDGSFPFGTAEYYTRYRSRYKALLKRFSQLAPAEPVDVLDVGGGQLALLASKMWNDRCSVSELPGEPQLEYLRTFGIRPVVWNLCKQEQPCVAAFDFIFFSEVIEHLPIPGYLPLRLLRKALRPGGILICSTPNMPRTIPKS